MAEKTTRKAIANLLQIGAAKPIPPECADWEEMRKYEAILYSKESGALNRKNGIVLRHKETGELFAAVGRGGLGWAFLWL